MLSTVQAAPEPDISLKVLGPGKRAVDLNLDPTTSDDSAKVNPSLYLSLSLRPLLTQGAEGSWRTGLTNGGIGTGNPRRTRLEVWGDEQEHRVLACASSRIQNAHGCAATIMPHLEVEAGHGERRCGSRASAGWRRRSVEGAHIGPRNDLEAGSGQAFPHKRGRNPSELILIASLPKLRCLNELEV